MTLRQVFRFTAVLTILCFLPHSLSAGTVGELGKLDWNFKPNIENAGFQECNNFNVPISQVLTLAQTGIQGATASGNAGILSTLSNTPFCPSIAMGASISVDKPCMEAATNPMMGMGMGMGMGGMGGMGMPGMIISTGNTAAAPQASPMCDANSDAFRAQKMGMDFQLCGALCKKGKLLAIAGQLSCMGAKITALEADMGRLQMMFQNNINAIQNQVIEYRNLQADNKAQMEDANIRLTGTKDGAPGSKAPGSLLDLKEKTTEMLKAIPNEIQEARRADQEAVRSEQGLAKTRELSKGARMMNCFNSFTDPNQRCTPNSPPVPLKEFILCRGEQEGRRGSNGIIEKGKEMIEASKRATVPVAKILDQIAADSPKEENIPNTPEEALKQASAKNLITKYSDVVRVYGQQMSSINVAGVSLASIVLPRMAACDKRAEGEIKNIETNPNSSLGKIANDIKVSRQENTAKIQSLFNKYGQQYSDNIAGLTAGKHTTLNLSQCEGRPAKFQIGCLEQVRTRIEDTLLGKSEASIVNTELKGTRPGNVKKISCRGLEGCISAIQGAHRNLDVEKKTLLADKKEFITKANQEIKTRTKAIASTMNDISATLKSQLTSLRLGAGQVGAGGSFPAVNDVGEEWRFGREEDVAEGLIEAPNSAFKTVGKYVSPPLADISASQILTLSQSMSQQANMIDQTLGTTISNRSEFLAGPEKCKVQQKQASVESLSAQIAEIQAANCGGTNNATVKDCRDQTSELIKTLNEIDETTMPPGAVADLKNGAQRLCRKKTLRPGQEDNTIGDACDSISNAVSKAQAVRRLSNDGRSSSVGGR